MNHRDRQPQRRGGPAPHIYQDCNVEESDSLTGNIIGAAIEVHRFLGPGLLESAYVECLTFELRLREMKVECQKPLPVFYKDVMLDCGYRLDLMVEEKVIIEIKSVSAFSPVHDAQLLSYLKLSRCKVGLLINFNVKILKDGIRRLACII
jgi:GxxExxY protein